MPTPVVASGSISECANSGCGYMCCEFNQGNYIVMAPGEAELARSRGESLDHLDLSPLPYGGWRAICRAGDTATCDRGYKPLDCQSYPLFPTLDNDGHLAVGLKGAKCPLSAARIEPHRRWVERRWKQLIEKNPTVARWLARVRLVGYQRIKTKPE